VASKVLEKIRCDQLTKFMDLHRLLPNSMVSRKKVHDDSLVRDAKRVDKQHRAQANDRYPAMGLICCV
jgi:hypothetical protein